MAKGIVTTFYSYKGGVGRSFTLANIGALLSRWGYKVLCVDWDLESPGLSQYFGKYLTGGKHKIRSAMMGGVVEYVEAISTGGAPDWQQYITKFDLPKSKVPISLMVAGEQNESYTERLRKLAWEELYKEHGLGKFLEQMRAKWKENYDFILVDSRTGVTDIGGISTIQFPDIFAFFFTANYQSLDGAVNIAKRVLREHKQLPYDRGGLIILPVLSRFDMREEYEQGNKWLGITKDKVRPFYMDWLHKKISVADIIDLTTVPYMSYWSFGERLAVVEDPKRDSESINYRLETLAALIAKECSETKKLVENRDSFVASVSKEEVPLKRKRNGEKAKLKADCEKILREGNVLEWRKLVDRLWSGIPERIIEWKASGERVWKKGKEEREAARFKAVEICLPSFVPIFVAVESGKRELWKEAVGSLQQLALLSERMGGGFTDVINIGYHMLYIAGSLGMAIAARTKQLDFVNSWMRLPMPATKYWDAGEKTWAKIYYAHRLWGKLLPGAPEPFKDLWKVCQSEYLSSFFTDKKLFEKHLFLGNLLQSLFEMGRCVEDNECLKYLEDAKKRFKIDLDVWPVWVLMESNEFKSGTWDLFGTSEGILNFVFPKGGVSRDDFWTMWKRWKEICVKPIEEGTWQRGVIWLRPLPGMGSFSAPSRLI